MENSPHENEIGRIDFVKFDFETPTVRFTKDSLINLIHKILIIVLLISLIGVVCWHFHVKDSSENDILLFSSQFSISKASDSKIERKREFVREMGREAWDAYSRVAWGHEALKPVTKKAYFWKFGSNSGLTIVNSMSTLWTMGLMEEFENGKQWIETKLNFSQIKSDVLVFEAVTYYVGGLLSCYALTGDVMFRDKAKEIALILEPAFSNPTGIPYEDITPSTRNPTDSAPYLSYMAGYQVDFFYLTDISGDSRFRDQIIKIRLALNKIEKTKNLFFNMVQTGGTWDSHEVNLFTLGKEFYSNLVKTFIQSNQKDVQSIEMYKEALDALEAIKLFDISRTGLYYARRYYNSTNVYGNDMEYSACHLGAMLSMGANEMQRALALNKTTNPNERREELYRIYRHSMLAERLTDTCHQASIKTRTGMGPKLFFFNATNDASISGRSYSLSPELAESYFILWRLTRDVKYRDYAWEMAQAIHRHCRVDGNGYSSIDNVDQIPTKKSNYQPPNFLGATLKYLYLTFSDDTLLPLDQWIFNAQGHPLPICGKNPAYPEDKCKS